MTERIVAAFVPLVDCAVLVAAREHGFAAEAAAWADGHLSNHAALASYLARPPSSDVPAYLRQFEMHTPFAVARSA